MTARTPAAEKPGVATERPTLLLGLFFASGFAGLVYQVLWMRELGALFGNTAYATATTLAAFFLGIAAGGAAFGRLAACTPSPLRGYGALEAAVTVSALLYFGLLDFFHLLYAPLFERFAAEPAQFVAAKFALALAVLFPPAFFMGGTLPMLAQHLVRSADRLGVTAALLYAVNTLGAACGAYLAGFHLVRSLGVRGAYAVALLTTAAVAGVAWRLGGAAAPSAAASAQTRREPTRLAPAAVLGLALLSGATTLSLEVLWTRMFVQVLQNSVYTFAAILVTFLLALALGAILARWLARGQGDPATVLVGLMVNAGLLVAVTPFAFVWVTDGLASVAVKSGFGAYVLRIFATMALVLAAPTALLGVVFPYLMKVGEGFGRSAGRTVGDLVAVNTVGGVIGSLVAGFVLLPALGMWRSIELVAALYLASALAVAFAGSARRLALAAVPAGALVLVAVALDPSELPLVSLPAAESRERIVEVVEGSAATVAVIERQGALRIKLNNHYAIGSSSDSNQESRQAHLPLALHPNPRRVFFLGMGTGISAGAALQHPVDHVAVAELVPEVVDVARRHFGPWVHGLFEDPRATILAEDGRNVLLGTHERYDVIVADMFQPWKAGVGSLYSRELYEAALARLAPGGLYAQWLALFQVSAGEFGSIARTMVEVFPRVTLWRGNFRVSQPIVMLVGERDPAPLGAEVIDARLAAIELSESERAYRGLGSAPAPANAAELLHYYQGNLSAVRALLDDHPINTENRPVIEYASPVTHRQKRIGEAESMRGEALLAFYDAVFERAPPEDDARLAGFAPEQAVMPRVGLDLYRAQVLRSVRDVEGARAALERARSHVQGQSPGPDDAKTDAAGTP